MYQLKSLRYGAPTQSEHASFADALESAIAEIDDNLASPQSIVDSAEVEIWNGNIGQRLDELESLLADERLARKRR